MNTTKQQAELYRKAAETIEICAPHGIEPCVKYNNSVRGLCSLSLNDRFDRFEFPLAVREGRLVWADTVVYNSGGYSMQASGITGIFGPYTLTPPKRTVMVELLEEYAEAIASLSAGGFSQSQRIEEACRNAIDNKKYIKKDGEHYLAYCELLNGGKNE